MSRQSNSPVASARPRRSPLSSKNRISIKNREPGYFYRIVNDSPGNVELLQERGYEIVPKEELGGTIGDKRVDLPSSPGSAAYISVGQGIKAVCMRIKEDWYKEDQSIKQAEVDASEQTMKQDAKKASDYGNFNF